MTEGPVCGEAGTVYLGYIRGPHGLKGGVLARVFTTDGAVPISEGTELLLEGIGEYAVSRSHVRNSETVHLRFEGVRCREESEKLVGARLRIAPGEIDRTPGLLPLYGTVGMRIVSGEMEYSVVDVEALPSNPLLILRGAEGNEFGVPLNLVMSGKVGDGVIEVELPDGLEDLGIGRE